MKKKVKINKNQKKSRKNIGVFSLLWKVTSHKEKIHFALLMCLGVIASMAVLIPTQVISIIISKLSGESIQIFGLTLSNEIGYGTIIIVGAITTFAMRIISTSYDLSIEKLIKKVVANLRKYTYDWLVTPRKNMDLKMTQGDAIYRLNQAPDMVTDVIVDFFTTVIPSVLSAIIAFVYIILLDLQTIPVLLVGILLVALCVFVRAKIERHISFRTEKAKSSLSSSIANSITNLPLINLYKSMLFESNLFSNRVDNFYTEQKRQINLRWAYWFCVRILEVAATFAIIFLCARRIYLGTMIVGNIVIIANYVAQIFSPIQTIGYFAARWIQCSVAVDRLVELKPEERQLLPQKPEFNEEIKSIELSHICAENSGGFNLNNVNLKFEKGKLTVVTGESGCGKSTLIKLLCGLCERTSGDIIINDKNKIFSPYLAVNRMSVSMQDAYIFNRDVRLNILYPVGSIDEGDYSTVIEDLSLGGVMKRKYNEESEHNLENMLSGGEKKRIGISRALIKKADVYIFDEPTNDLDNNNANKVINSIIKLKDNAIVIVVTHDDRVKAVADQMIYFKERGVIENTNLNEVSEWIKS